MIYLDVITPEQARAEFDRLFAAIDRHAANQKIFDAVKLGHAPHSRARLLEPKAELAGEDTSEGGAR